MTKLTKVVKRSVAVPNIIRPVNVTLDPETKSIGFAEKGCHKIYWLPIYTAYLMAIRVSERKDGTK